MSTLVVVDGPNLMNRVGEYLTNAVRSSASQEVQRAYYREWFDIDRLVTATLGGDRASSPWRDLGTVIFRSRKAVGRDSYRIRQEDLADFWTRQGTNPNSAVMVVEIPGGPSGGKEDEKEKGIDMSMAVYLFETLEQWETAVLFTNDTDFVPAVWSLRRKGKRVHCASRDNAGASPLAAACQHFLPLALGFLLCDRALFELLQPGAAIDQFLAACLRRHDALPNKGPMGPSIFVQGGAIKLAHPCSAIQAAVEELNALLDNTVFVAVPHSENTFRLEPKHPARRGFSPTA